MSKCPLNIINFLQLFAVFVVRGRPYSAEDVSRILLPSAKGAFSGCLRPLVALTWSVVVPIGLLVLGVVSFKSGR